ncbi:MAG: CaiB/BaiF CoA transferase family protein [Nocardioidaceae bacterium]
MTSPLEGVRVLDLSRFLAGPYASWVLSELGADVVKVEDPDRPDEARTIGPFFQHGQSLYFAALNSGKRSLAVRLRTPSGRELLRDLVRTVDVVLDNHKPGVMEQLGLGPVDLSSANPAVVTCSLSGFGATGPLSQRAGYDYTIQALSGVMSMTGEPEAPPGKAGISYVDHSGGLAAALAVCAALVGRSRCGRGGHIDLALYDVQMSMLSYLAAWQLNEGFTGERTPSASHPSLVPAQNFATADGYVSIFVGNDAMWRRLTEAVPDPYLSAARFGTNAGRQDGRAGLLERLGELVAARPSTHWVDLFERHAVPCAPINDLEHALTEPQIVDRQLVASADHPVYGTYRYVSGPLPRMRTRAAGPAPLLGEHSADVLAEAGLSGVDINNLAAAGTIATSRTSSVPTEVDQPEGGR